jgi:putative ABC transport system permease protein
MMSRVLGTRSDVAIRLGILLRGIGSRPAPAIVLFVASAVAVAAAAIGPIFLRAGDLSLLASGFASAPRGEPALLVLGNGGAHEFARLVRTVDGGVRHAGGLLERPTVTADAGSSFAGAQKQHFRADVLARSGLCAHLRFTQGHCPKRLDEVAISGRSARAAGVAVGSRLRLGVSGRRPTVGVAVVGVYRQPSSVANPYWGGANYFAFGTGKPELQQLDPLVGSFATALAYARVTAPQLSADVPWSPRAAFAGESALETTLRTTTARIASVPSLRASTRFGDILAKAAAGAHLMRSIVLAIVLQLVLLVVVVLYSLARSTAVGRRHEAEFARRHGFTRPAMFALAVGEPAALIVAAVPVGLLVAWAVVILVSRSLFVGGTPVAFEVWSVVAAVGVCCVEVLAVALASVELWRREDSSRSHRAALAEVAVDVSAVVLALAGFLALATGGTLGGTKTDALALLAPGLLALGSGVLALRLVLGLIALAIRRTGESSHLASFLALRELGRRPAALRQALPLAAAVTVCLFAVGSYARAASNRDLFAHFEVGSDRVVDVSVKPGFDLERAVRRADPSGRAAMAAVLYNSSYGRLLAVDSTRLAAVGTWPPDLSAQAKGVIARRLAARGPAPVVVRGDAVQLRIALPAGTPALSLALDLYDEVYGRDSTLELGPVTPGTHVYRASLRGNCPGACRVLDLSPSWERPNEHIARTVRIGLLAIADHSAGRRWRQVPFGSAVASWRVESSPAHVEPSPTRRGVVFAVPGPLLSAGGVLFVPASAADHVRAVVTTELEQINPPTPPGNTISLAGLDGNPLTVDAISTVPTLPLVGTNGAIVDLSSAERDLTGPIIDSTNQVWLSDAAGPGIVRSLRAMGVTIGGTRRAATLRSRLDHSGTALGYDLMLIISAIAALLALGTIMFEIVSNGRRRRGDLASLRVAGLPGGIVRRSLLLENLAVLATALIVGAGVGFGALALALPSLPEFVAGTNLLPISTNVPVAPVVEAALCLAFVFCVTAGSTTWLVLTGPRPREEVA